MSAKPSDRRIPGWAAGIVSRMVQNSPAVVGREDIKVYLLEASSGRDVESTIRELRRLGWLQSTSIKGVWSFLPPGQEQILDPYLDLRAWRHNDDSACFALAADHAAWHLGYLDRAPEKKVTVWIPDQQTLPHGLRSHVGVVRLGWEKDMLLKFRPKPRLLRKRGLDLVTWASGLPAFGPEAIITQLATRPSSFGGWADLVAHLEQLVDDIDGSILVALLKKQSSSAWQRAAYLLHSGGNSRAANDVFAQRPNSELASVQLGVGNGPAVWSAEFGIADRLIIPLQLGLGKA